MKDQPTILISNPNYDKEKAPVSLEEKIAQADMLERTARAAEKERQRQRWHCSWLYKLLHYGK